MPIMHAGTARAADDGGLLRKKLFLLERQLSRSAGAKGGGDTKVEVNGPLGPDEMKKEIEEAMKSDSTGSASDTEASAAAGDAVDADDKKQKDFGSVTAKLDGGSLTSYSYSGTGLDLSKVMPGYGVVLLLQSNEIDISGLEKDASMNDKFAGANREKFYGLKDYKDMENMFAKQAPGKDYTMMGLGLNMDMGAYSLGIVNYSRPPQRKKKVFFGSDSAGPYQIGSTALVPGSESVRVAGGEITRGSGYEINYNRGEITFTAPVALNDKIVVEYELAQSGGGPGKFTGFRFQTGDDKEKKSTGAKKDESKAETKPAASAAGKKFGLKDWGMTYLKDQVVTFMSNGDSVDRGFQDHGLVGFDGKAALGRFGEAGFEFAQSDGNKSMQEGRYASASFTIADTHASDKDPSGPYYLDETKLPILENTDEVRINGVLLERDKDYSLDTTYGQLRLRKKDLDLGLLDTISVNYRYLTDEDRRNTAAEGTVKDSASKVSLKNEFGKLKHTYEVSRFGPDYMQVGGAVSNNLLDTKQTLSAAPLKGLDLKFDRGLNKTLKDRASGLGETAEKRNYSLGYKRGSKLAFSWRGGEDLRYDNLAVHQTDTRRDAADWSLDIEPRKDWKAGYKSSTSRNTTALQNGGANVEDDVKQTLTFAAKLRKNLSFNTTQTTGNNRQDSGGEQRDRTQKSADYAVKYQPFKSLKLDYSLMRNSFSSAAEATAAATAAAELPATDPFATGTADAASTGNTAEKIAISFNPNQRLSISAGTQKKVDDNATGSRATVQNTYDTRYKLGKSASLQYRASSMSSDRVNQSQDTTTKSYIFQFKTKALPRGLNIDIKRDEQASNITSTALAAGTTTATKTGSTSNTLMFTAEPFWEGKSFRFEYQSKRGGNETNDVSTPEGEIRRSLGFEVPFIGESALSFELNRRSAGGSRPTRQRDLGVTLSGKLTKLFDLQFSYKTKTDTDLTTPSASTHSSDMNIVLKGELKF